MGDESAATHTRKGFLVGAAAAGATLAGPRLLGTPPAAASRGQHAGRPPKGQPGGALSPPETATLVAWCELIVPGADSNDVGDFVNDQLAKPDEEALLLIRYLTLPPPYDDFYREGVAAIDTASETAFGQRFVELTEDERSEILDGVLSGDIPWTGPQPAFRFYFITRHDAVDVVYGTVEGFARIDFPYQALIEPKRPW